MADPFKRQRYDINGPMIGGFAITPHNTNELPFVTRKLFVGGAGNVTVVWFDGTETIEPVLANTTYDWGVKIVKATGTTATGLRGFY